MRLRDESRDSGIGISDVLEARRLVSESGPLDDEGRWGRLEWVREWWESHAPELAEIHPPPDAGDRTEGEADLLGAAIRKWRERQRERAEYLVAARLLTGEALEWAERRQRW